MAICEFCKREMITAKGCSLKMLKDKEGKKYNRIPYGEGDEAKYITKETHPRCHDCNVLWGKCHHPWCDVEKCPKCGGQLIFCDCFGLYH